MNRRSGSKEMTIIEGYQPPVNKCGAERDERRRELRVHAPVEREAAGPHPERVCHGHGCGEKAHKAFVRLHEGDERPDGQEGDMRVAPATKIRSRLRAASIFGLGLLLA